MMPFAAETGISLAEAGPDRVVAVLPWAPRLCTSGGILHGGALMTLADSAGALVAFLSLPEGASTAMITSTTQLFRPVNAGSVRAVERRATVLELRAPVPERRASPGRA